MGSETLPKLPTINFSEQNLSPGTNSWFSTCIEVQHALEEYGRFVAVFDEVTLEIHNAIFRTLKELFDLPTETKIQTLVTSLIMVMLGNSPSFLSMKAWESIIQQPKEFKVSQKSCGLLEINISSIVPSFSPFFVQNILIIMLILYMFLFLVNQ